MQVNSYEISFREINLMLFMAYFGDILSMPLVKQ